MPPELASLEGLDCRILLRDGPRPEIVLQPDMTQAIAVLELVWDRLTALLSLVGGIGDLPLQEFDLVLLPASSHYGKPVLAFADALRAGAQLGMTGMLPVVPGACDDEESDDGGPLGRLVVSLGTLAGRRVGLGSVLAPRFGAMLARLGGSNGAFPCTSPEEEIIRHLWEETCGPSAGINALLAASNEDRARQALRQIIGQYRDWQEHPERHECTGVPAEMDRSLYLGGRR